MKALRYSLLPALLLAAAEVAHAQAGRYLTRTGAVSFFSASPLEDIEAHSQQTSAVLELPSGQLAFSLPIRSFQFKRSLMQEHFNENYLESERYPKATFTGRLVDWKPELLREGGGPLAVMAEGDLTMHGVTRRIRVPGTLTAQNGQLLINSSFQVAPADYQITIPALVRDHIAKSVLVKVRLQCTPAPTTASTRP